MPLVQKNGGTVTTNASVVTSLGVATTAGNTILIFANSGGTVATPSGFTSRSPQVNAQGFYLFEKLVAAGNSTDTPTLTVSGPYNTIWQIAEYAGITAYDTSTSGFATSFVWGAYPTPLITPSAGNRRLIAFVGADSISTTFVAGDPQAWTNNFTGQQSAVLVGAGGAGTATKTSGWADFLTLAGGNSFLTSASMGSVGGNMIPVAIIASYTTTDVPAVNPWPTFKSISSIPYASHTNTVVTAPISIVDGDILILGFAIGAASPPAATLPAGFTLVDTAQRAGAGGFNVDQYVAWKRASSESGSYTITHATASSNAFISVYSGCIATGSPIDGYAKAVGFYTPTAVGSSLVSSVANTMCVYIDHDWQGLTTRTPPSPMVERYDNLEYSCDNPVPSAGGSGSVGATNSNNLGDPWGAWSILLLPASQAPAALVSPLQRAKLWLRPWQYQRIPAASISAAAGGIAVGSVSNTPTYATRVNSTITAPTGITNGDLLVAAFFAGNGSTTAVTVTPPAGFVEVTNSPSTTFKTDPYSIAMHVYYKVASGESGNYVFTHATADTEGYMYRLTGVNTTTPIDVAAVKTAGDQTTNGQTTTYPSLTTVTNGAFIICAEALWDTGSGAGTVSGTGPTITTRRAGTESWIGDGTQTTAGATGSRTRTPNGAVAPGEPWASIVVAIRPAAAGGVTNYTMPADPGAITLAGTATGLRAARQLAAANGAIALAGTATGLKCGRVLTAVKGSIALAGLAAGLRAARRLTAVQGAITLTGFAAGLVYSSFKTLTAAVGSITLAGQAATFRLTRVMAAAKGTISLTGFDVVLTKTSAVVNKILTAAAGAFTFVGQDAALRRERRLPAAIGTVTLAGQAAVLRVTRMLAAAKGTITLAGSDTLLLKGKSPLLATTGAILVAGNTANLVYRASYRMAAASASIRLAAREAGLSRSGTEQPGVMEFGRKAYLRRW